jgi:hypothetical protein
VQKPADLFFGSYFQPFLCDTPLLTFTLQGTRNFLVTLGQSVQKCPFYALSDLVALVPYFFLGFLGQISTATMVFTEFMLTIIGSRQPSTHIERP